MPLARSEGALAAAGASAPAMLLGSFNLTLWGDFAGSAQLERSFDAGRTWHPLSRDSTGAVARYAAPVSLTFEECERGVLYRLNCTALDNGVLRFRLSQ